MRHNMRLHWVEVDVTQQREEVAIGIDQPSPVTSLEQMPGRSEPPVTISRVPPRDSLHHATQWLLANLQQRVEMIATYMDVGNAERVWNNDR